MTDTRPCALAMSVAPRRSITSMNIVEYPSVNSMRVFGFKAPRTLSRSRKSTKSQVTPYLAIQPDSMA
nr:hypothetical protein [Cohnella rhizosphaerae]